MKKNLILLICLIIVCGLFIPTLIRPFLIYDERILLEGIYFPIPNSLSEFSEIIKKFGLNFSILSSNTIYSSNYITRTCPFGQLFGMLLSFFFKKEPLFYHIFNLILHLINTCLIYFILNVFLKNKYYLVAILTLIWAVHPVTMESVLLSINFGAPFTYMFFLGLLLDFLINKEKNKSIFRQIIIPILFLILMFINEYIVTLPFIFFTISFYSSYQNNSLKEALKRSIQETQPYFLGFFLYVIYFFLFSHYNISQVPSENYFVVLLERIFWLSPQVFVHMLKLIFYPEKLSVDQTIFVQLGKSLVDPYSTFCIALLFIWLFIPLILFISRKKMSNIFLLCWTFFFALMPFLHILMPSYTLAAERYLYTPLAMLIIGIAKMLSDKTNHKLYLTLLSIVLICCLIRSHYRTLDWKDNYSFINSTYKISTDPLFKAMRAGMLGKAISVLEPHEKTKIENYFKDSLKLLNIAKVETIKNKLKYQEKLPLVIKSYGLDYESLLTKIAFLEASSSYIELKEDYMIGLGILEPYTQKLEKIDPRILELYVHFLTLDKRYDEVKKILLRTNEIYPNTAFVLLALVDFFYKQNESQEAEKYLKQALKLLPYDINVLSRAVNFYQDINRSDLTAKYAYFYGLRMNSEAAYQKALFMYLNLGNLKEAKKAVDKLLLIKSNNPASLYFVSKYYYKIKEYQKAVSSLVTALEISKQSNENPGLTFDIAYTLAQIYLSLGNKDMAIFTAKDTIMFAGNNLEALKKLANLYKSLGLTEQLNYCLQKINQNG